MLTRLATTLTAALLLALPAAANGSTLAATVDGSLMDGATITLDLTGSFPNALTFLAVGDTAGSTTLKLPGGNSLVLDLDQPFAIFPLGTTDDAGAVSASFSTPAIPIELDPILLNGQAVSIDVKVGGGPPQIQACVSNATAITIQ